MIEMMTKHREGTLTQQETVAWGEFLRKRDLSPSIDNQLVFSRQHPHDKTDYAIELKDGADVLIEVFSKWSPIARFTCMQLDEPASPH